MLFWTYEFKPCLAADNNFGAAIVNVRRYFVMSAAEPANEALPVCFHMNVLVTCFAWVNTLVHDASEPVRTDPIINLLLAFSETNTTNASVICAHDSLEHIIRPKKTFVFKFKNINTVNTTVKLHKS